MTEPAKAASPANKDTVKESIDSGKLTTENNVKVEAKGPAVGGHLEEHEEARPLTYEEQEEIVGDLEYGESGWIPLTETGEIAGPAQKGQPPSNQPFALVVRPADTRTPLITTPSGALLSNRLNVSKRVIHAQKRDYATKQGSIAENDGV